MIRAILWAQWLSMRTLRVGTRARGAIFSAVTGLLFYGFWGFVAFAAEAFSPTRRTVSYSGWRFRCRWRWSPLYWQVAPVVSASLGASLDLNKLIVYPIPRERLFAVEIMLRLATCFEMLIVVAGILAGVMRNPRFGGLAAAPRQAATVLVFITFNLFLSAGMRNLLERSAAEAALA